MKVSIMAKNQYDAKTRMKAGLKRFLKGLLATLLVAGVQYGVEFVQTSADLFPAESALTGLVVSTLIGLEKALQKRK